MPAGQTSPAEQERIANENELLRGIAVSGARRVGLSPVVESNGRAHAPSRAADVGRL